MKLGVCVPYRNREAHLKEFIPKIGKYLDGQGIDYCIYFGHQVDDKLFNRGATKNIAAEWAFKEGCDYVVYHDIDMIPEEGGGADYTFPKDNHIATSISQMDYKLKYEEYFGGAVLFSKEQVEKTNGYSNDYWDWGMEDDDLFWRCVLEGYADDTYMDYPTDDQTYLNFNGLNSFIKIDKDAKLRNVTSRSHTVSILVRAYQQEDKVNIWLVGDDERRFCEYPIIRRPGYDWGLSYNNSRAYTAQLWDNEKNHLYQWIKRYEGQWTWITLKVDSATQKIHFYLNGKESDARHGHGTQSPLSYENRLKSYGMGDWYIGTTTSARKNDINRWLKGDIGKVYVWNRNLSDEEIKDIHKNVPENKLVLHYDFNSEQQKNSPYTAVDLSGNELHGSIRNAELKKGQIKIPYTIIPHRIPGKLKCLPHKDEGLVKNKDGKEVWAKGETTARNERRYVLQMQQGTWDYKSDGIKQLKYELVGIEEITPKAKLINVKF